VPNTQVQRVTNPAMGTIVVKGWAAVNGGPIPGLAAADTPNLTGTTRLPTTRSSRASSPRATSVGQPTATTYTATYTGLPNDVGLAMGVGEARTLWLGSNPLNP